LTALQIQSATQPLLDDAVQTEKEVASLVAAYRAHGVAGVAALVPALAQTAGKDYEDVATAVPAIKSGWRTSEFWVIIGIGLVDLYFGVTGKETPTTVTEILTVLGAAYGVSRGITKKA
jgi:hypothetical protein